MDEYANLKTKKLRWLRSLDLFEWQGDYYMLASDGIAAGGGCRVVRTRDKKHSVIQGDQVVRMLDQDENPEVINDH